MIEEMERLMERRFKEMATSIANVALRRGTPDSVAAPVVEEAASPMKVERSPRHVVPSPSPSDGTRGDLIMIADRVEDIENDFNRRWQTLEERLRIIGRATVNRPGVAPSNAPAIDRKAREDSSMSLMRVQKLERDIAALKRQLSEANARGGNDGRVPEWPEATEEKGSPHYGGEEYGSKVKSLEQDVERRMAEVNRTIAMLRGEHAGGNLNYANLLATPPRRDPSDPAPSGMSGGDIMDPPLRSSAEAASEQPTSQRVMDTTGGNELTKPSYIVLRSTEVDEEPDYDGSLQLHSARVVPSSWPSRPQPKTSRENTSRSSQFRTTHPTSEREAPSRPDSVPLEYAADAGVAVPPAAADVPQRQLDEERRKQSIRRLDEYGANITSSLGHQKPCVIANCAWCAAEREQDSVAQ
ncbi:hypothetical protein AGDE_14883 [Angomonas deanei]|nr:hypothetical protein AGDE_14883 [Angomonas deanei]|eukprot:EPY20055.1 hypothetical protein AGDE_14883 [Angomonas deanei]